MISQFKEDAQMAIYRICEGCGEAKHISEYYRVKGGTTSKCVKCLGPITTVTTNAVSKGSVESIVHRQNKKIHISPPPSGITKTKIDCQEKSNLHEKKSNSHKKTDKIKIRINKNKSIIQRIKKAKTPSQTTRSMGRPIGVAKRISIIKRRQKQEYYVGLCIPGIGRDKLKAIISRADRLHVDVAIVVDAWKRCRGKCELCGKEISLLSGDKPLCVACCDHNHETGSVRGMLCVKCNLMIAGYEMSIRMGEDKIKKYLGILCEDSEGATDSRGIDPWRFSSGQVSAAIHRSIFRGSNDPFGKNGGN